MNADIIYADNKMIGTNEKQDYQQIEKPKSLIDSDKNYLLFFTNEEHQKVFLIIRNKNVKLEEEKNNNKDSESVSSESFKAEIDSNLFHIQNVLSTDLNPDRQDGFTF